MYGEIFGEAISCLFIVGLKHFYLNVLTFEGSYKMHTTEGIQGKTRAQVNANLL